MVYSDNRGFSMMVLTLICIPILPLLLLITVSQPGKIAPLKSVQNQDKKAKPSVEICVIIDTI